MIPGAKLILRGQEFTAPPLTLGALRRLQPQIEAMSGIGIGMSGETVDALGLIVATALQPNYPDITPQRVIDELIDLGNAGDVFRAIMGRSGLREPPPGEAEAPDHGPGQAPASASAGPGSTASSPPPAAGP